MLRVVTITQVSLMTPDELMQVYSGFAVTVSRDYMRRGVDRGALSFEDAEQEAFLALFEAGESFVGEVPSDKFKVFLRGRIQNALLAMISGSAYAVSGSRDGLRVAARGGDYWSCGFPLDDKVAKPKVDASLSIEDRANFEMLVDLFDLVLTRRQAAVMRLYYVDGIESDKLVGEHLGVQRVAVLKARTRAEKKLKEYVEFD